MKVLVLLALSVACAFADDEAVEATKYAYHGLYADACDLDGLYYKDVTSFVMCTSGISYVQACAPGTENDKENKFTYGGYYSLGSFCGYNTLVAGYNPVANAYHAPLPSFHAKLNTVHAPLNTYHAPLNTHHAALPVHHAALPVYHAPLPVHRAPVANELPEGVEVEDVETEVEAGFSRKGLFEGYGQQAGKFVFRGKYADECKSDGLYYRDFQSYVICSNNNAYVQPCAPGTRNSMNGNYARGGYYSYADFCNVNLTDFGYAAKRSAYNYAKRLNPLKYGYGYGLKGHGLKGLGLKGLGLKGLGLNGLGLGYGLGYGYGY